MNIPGFTAQAALSMRQASSRIPLQRQGFNGPERDRLTPQFDFPWWWPWPPYTPTGPLPTTPPPPPPPGWTYPPGWTPPYPGWTPPPGYPPPPAGWHLGLGGTILTALGAVAAGTAIGAGLGLGTEAVITPTETPAGSLNPTCVNAPGPRTQRMIPRSYWGCERSLTKTINEAHAICGKRQSCVGTCANGATCIATATINDVVQTPGLFMCDTALYFTCDCGC